MTRSVRAQYSFASGEISPLLYGRPDYQRVQSGLRQCRGFLPLRQGGATRAPGTIWRGATHGNGASRLMPFEFAADDSVILEFGQLVMRVWRYGQLVMKAGVPYELATPYNLTAVQRLKAAQSADVIYLVDGVQPPQQLSRLALDDWRISELLTQRGPFELENDTTGSTIQSSGRAGSVTLTGAGNPFAGAGLGDLYRLRAIDDDTVPTWTGNTPVVPGDRMRFEGRIYEVVSGSDSFVNPPTHASGDVKTGKDGPVWRFIADRIGIVALTGVDNANTAYGIVVRPIPPAIVAAATHRWSEGAWSNKNGYPAAVTIFDDRLIFAGTRRSPRTLWGSTIGAYRDFEPSDEADGSFAYTISGVQSLNRILWLQAGSRGLHIGALGEELSSRVASGEVLGPQNPNFRSDSTIGSRDTQPIAPDGKLIFITRDGARLIELRFDFSSDANTPLELSLPAEHIGSAGFAEIAWQGAPIRLGWIRRQVQDFALLVYDAAEDVLGWAVYPLAAGRALSIAVTRSLDATTDVVTLVVARQIGGETRIGIEEVAPAYGVLGRAGPIAEAQHLFASRVKTQETPFDVIGNLGHLEGREVYCWTDRGELGPLTVAAGTVTLPDQVTRATVGLFDESHILETTDLVGAARVGDTLGMLKRANSLNMRCHRTAAMQVRSLEREFGRPTIASPWREIGAVTVPLDRIVGYSGILPVDIPTGPAPELTYQLRPVGGAPMTLLALAPDVDVAEA